MSLASAKGAMTMACTCSPIVKIINSQIIVLIPFGIQGGFTRVCAVALAGTIHGYLGERIRKA